MTGCTRETEPGEIIGDPCPDCGHTNLVHPGGHNPTIEECLLCILAAEAERISR